MKIRNDRRKERGKEKGKRRKNIGKKGNHSAAESLRELTLHRARSLVLPIFLSLSLSIARKSPKETQNFLSFNSLFLSLSLSLALVRAT